VCCEVAEHFYDPQTEFDRFHQLLHPDGLLVIKTELLTTDIDFPNWYYINDPTHTLFYSPKGMCLILEQHGFNTLELTPRLVVAKKV
jgi:hypothetical protein